MKLAILSRAPHAYSTQRLRAAAQQRGHQVKVLNTLRFAIDLATPWGPAHFDCKGKIVRLEKHHGVVGVAVQFSDADLPAAARRRQ